MAAPPTLPFGTTILNTKIIKDIKRARGCDQAAPVFYDFISLEIDQKIASYQQVGRPSDYYGSLP